MLAGAAACLSGLRVRDAKASSEARGFESHRRCANRFLAVHSAEFTLLQRETEVACDAPPERGGLAEWSKASSTGRVLRHVNADRHGFESHRRRAHSPRFTAGAFSFPLSLTSFQSRAVDP